MVGTLSRVIKVYHNSKTTGLMSLHRETGRDITALESAIRNLLHSEH